MAIVTELFDGDGTNKNFTVSATMLSKSHVRVDLFYGSTGSKLDADATDHLIPENQWDVLSATVLLDDAPANGYEVRISVSSDGTGLDSAPSLYTTVISNITAILNLSGIITDITTLSAMSSSLTSLFNDKATLDSLIADKATLDGLFSIKAKLDSIYADKTKLDSIFADKTTYDSLFADKISLDAIYANLSDVLASATNAWLAEASSMTANSHASEAVDVLTKTYTSVGDGTFTSVDNAWYSTLHYQTKAQETAITIPSKTSARNSVISAVDGVNALATTPTPSHKDVVYVGSGTAQDIKTGEADGVELITNGTFDTDTTGWTAQRSGILTVENGKLKVTDGATNYGSAYQAITTVIGEFYEVKQETTKGTSATAYLEISTTLGAIGSADIVYLPNSERYETIRFTAISTTTYITVSNQTSGYNYWDNISVKSISSGLPSISRPWVASASYTLLDATGKDTLVTHDYVIYKAKTAHSGVATTPDLDATNWEAIADGVHLDADNADVWIKSRSNILSHNRFDTLRGSGERLFTNATNVESLDATSLTSFNVDGFSLGADLGNNTNGVTFVAWTEYFDKMFSWVDDDGFRGITAYNAQSGKFMASYVGSGVAGKKVWHGLGTKPDFLVTKNRDTIRSWGQYNSVRGATEYMFLDTNAGSVADSTVWNDTEPTIFNFTVGTANNGNTLNENFIAYGSSNRKNHSYVGGYVGTGVVGNPVDVGMDLLALDTAGKKIKVMIKSFGVESWALLDNQRIFGNNNDGLLFADSSGAESTAYDILSYTNNGLIINNTGSSVNTSGVQYLIEVTVEDFDNPNGGLDLNPTTASYADGSNATGDADLTATTIAPATYPQIAGAKNYFYSDFVDADTVTLGSTDVKLLEGLNRVDADKWGIESPSDATLKTTDKHSDYASATGVISASSFYSAGFEPYKALNKTADDGWMTAVGSFTASVGDETYYYTPSEKRVFKSLRFKSRNNTDFDTTHPSDYVVSVKNIGDTVWTDVLTVVGDTAVSRASYGSVKTLSSTLPYDQLKINFTKNNSATFMAIGELELNTEHPSGDFYNVSEGVMYNSADTAIKRVYTGEADVDGSNEIIPDTWVDRAIKNQNLTDVTVHGDAEFLGDVSGKNICTAWVRFDGQVIPSQINGSYNISDIVRVSVGVYTVYFKEEMIDINYCVVGLAQSTNKNITITKNTATTKSFQVIVTDGDTATFQDLSNNNLVIFGGKA